MIELETINPDDRFRVILEDGLWNLEAYQNRNSTRLAELPGWNSTNAFIPAATGEGLSLPPVTESDESIARLQPGAIIQVERILFHSNNTANDGKAYQCLLVSTEVNNVTRSGFVWTVYEDTDYVECFTPPPPPDDTPPPPGDEPPPSDEPPPPTDEPPTDEPPPPDQPPGDEPPPPPDDQPPAPPPEGVQIEVKAGQTVVLDVKTKSTESSPTNLGDGATLNKTLIIKEKLIFESVFRTVNNARVRIIDSNGVVNETDFRTNNLGSVSIQFGTDDLIHIETPNKYSRTYRANELSGPGHIILFNLAVGCIRTQYQPPRLNESKFIPGFNIGPGGPIRYNIPHDQADPEYSLYVSRRLSNSQQYLSLGQYGRVLLKFDPPLVFVPGHSILKVTEVRAGEAYIVRFGNTITTNTDPLSPPPNANLPGATLIMENQRNFPLNLERINPLEISLTDHPAIETGQRFQWVEIQDNTENLRAPRQQEDSPGLDIRTVVGHVRGTHAITILLDISGSMSDNDAGEFYRAHNGNTTNGAIPNHRLYSNALNSILENLIPENNTHTDTTYRLYTFYGKGENRRIESQAGPTSSIDTFRQQIESLKNTDSFTNEQNFNRFTPLATAIRGGINYLANTSAGCRTLIVITDGDGYKDGVIDETFESITENDSTGRGERGGIELIGYNIFPNSTRRSFHQFELSNWAVFPHEVNEKSSLDDLFRKLRLKYLI